MSELIITPKSIEEIKIYQNADCFLLGNESFCVRYNHSYSNEEIIEAQKLIKSLNKKLYVNEKICLFRTGDNSFGIGYYCSFYLARRALQNQTY